MKKTVLLTMMVLGFLGCTQNTPLAKEVTKATNSENAITLLGTYTWDVESNKQGGNDSKVDFWLNKIDNKTSNLIPKNGATVEVTQEHYASVDKAYMQQFPIFRDGKVSNHDIKVGTVVMFKTAEGNYGKLRIVGFKALHDFHFKEAQSLDQQWREFVLTKPNIQKYHLVVEYKLYK